MKQLKILAVDSSAKSASVAVTDNGRLISECFVNNGLTHSRTLMPMVDNALTQADMTLGDIDALCVNAGPGSFTGIRIGVAAVKGLAAADNKPCAAVSTLESIAYNFVDENCIVCAAMDARCNQVYTAIFRCNGSEISRICEDKAVPVDELGEELSAYNEKIYLAGDGAEICFKAFSDKLKNVVLAGENRRYQRAFGVALACEKNNNFTDSALLAPVYLRLPQAERELRVKGIIRTAPESGSF